MEWRYCDDLDDAPERVVLEELVDFDPFSEYQDLWQQSLLEALCGKWGDSLLTPIAFSEQVVKYDQYMEFSMSFVGLPSQVNYLGIQVSQNRYVRFVLWYEGREELTYLRSFSVYDLPQRFSALKKSLLLDSVDDELIGE